MKHNSYYCWKCTAGSSRQHHKSASAVEKGKETASNTIEVRVQWWGAAVPGNGRGLAPCNDIHRQLTVGIAACGLYIPTISRSDIVGVTLENIDFAFYQADLRRCSPQYEDTFFRIPQGSRTAAQY